MTPPGSSPRFARDIEPLFRGRDRAAMRRFFDLGSYQEVRTHAQAILGHLSSGSVPCDGRRPDEQIALFRRRVDAGMPAQVLGR
jgi:hypothetical protein